MFPGKGIRETSSSKPVVYISNGSMLIATGTIWRGHTTDFVISGNSSILMGGGITVVNYSTHHSGNKVSGGIFLIGSIF